MKDLNDQQLLEETAALVKIERQTTAKVMEYLCEIDRRELWQKEGYSSLFDFCVRYLNYSESEAGRRIHVARCVQKVEAVKPMLESNSLSLTGLSLIASHLTRENATELLPKVERKSCLQIKEVLRDHFPEASLPEEVLKIVLDDELKTLLADAQRELSEKDARARGFPATCFETCSRDREKYWAPSGWFSRPWRRGGASSARVNSPYRKSRSSSERHPGRLCPGERTGF